MIASFAGSNGTISVSGANHNHNGSTGGMNKNDKGSITQGNSYIGVAGGATGNMSVADGGKNDCTDNSHPVRYGTINLDVSHEHSISDSGNLTMSGSFTPSGSVSLNGDNETRSSNYTERYWKRIA